MQNQAEIRSKKLDTTLRPYDINVPVLFPNFELPRKIGFFSVSADREFDLSDKEIRYFKEPKTLPLNLTTKMNSTPLKRPEGATDEGIDNILKFICDNKHKIVNDEVFIQKSNANERDNQSKLSVEFVTWRSLLTLIMDTPHMKNDWCIHATHYKGTVYLCRRDTNFEKLLRQNLSKKEIAKEFYQQKFAQNCLTGFFGQDADTTSRLDDKGEFVGVLRTKIAGMSILYGAEMKGVVSDQPLKLDSKTIDLNNLKFVDLEVCDVEQENGNFEGSDLRKWWLNNFLVNVQDIYVGKMNPIGNIYAIDHLLTNKLYRAGAKSWVPSVCVHFLAEFLKCVMLIASRTDCPYTTYEFYFNTDTGRITYECMKDKTIHSFLPDWYIRTLQAPLAPIPGPALIQHRNSIG